MKVPYLKKKPEIKSCHNIEWEDNYSWIHQKNILEVLKDKSKLDPEVKKYLEEENTYTEHHLKDTKKIQKILFDEIKGRIKLDDESLPYKDKNYEYWTKTTTKGNYSIKLRRKIGEEKTIKFNFDGHNPSYIDMPVWHTHNMKNVGQKPLVTKARKSVANFKIRDGMPIGCKVTLRGDRMFDFLQRLLAIAIPRERDFRGLEIKSFDGRGNYSLGIKEHIIFPEIDYDKVDKIRGLDICITTSAEDDKTGEALLKAMKFPFKN